MATIEEMIRSSKCFGLAYDSKVKECKICEVYLKCKTKCEMGGCASKPVDVEVGVDADEISMTDEAAAKSAAKDTEVQVEKSKKKKSTNKVEKQYDPDMPDLTTMDVPELKSLVEERGGHASDYDKYTNDQIKKMRMKMFIKKTYEI